MKIIDPHLHLFDLKRGKYQWLQPASPPYWEDKGLIYRNFQQQDLILSQAQLAGFVHIEAGFDNDAPAREIAWLQQTITMPFKSIANANLCEPSKRFSDQLDVLRDYSSVVGVRHIFDDDAASLLSQPQVIHNLASLARRQLIFETQLNGTDTQAIELLVDAAQHTPALTIILSHQCFCPVGEGRKLWQQNMKILSGCRNILIKASGWEMVARDYAARDVEYVVKQLLAMFGSQRVMLASNFPLCLFRHSYESHWQMMKKLSFDSQTLAAISYHNARKIYGFDAI